MSIERESDLTTEFRRIVDQPAPPYLPDLGQIVASGRRAKRRRTTLAASTAVGVIAVCGIATVVGISAQHGSTSSVVGPASVASTAHAHSTATASTARYTLPSSVSGAKAASMQAAVSRLGFTHVAIETTNSDTVPAGDVIDIVDTRNRSLLGKTVSTDTPLTLLVSLGPAH